MPARIEYRKRIARPFAGCGIAVYNPHRPFRQRNIDCTVRFPTIVRQSSVHDIIGCRIRRIDERNSPAQIRECKNVLCQSAEIALRRTIRLDDFHYIRLAQRPFRGAGVESAHLIVGKRILLAGNGFRLNRPIEHGSQSTHLKTLRRIFISPRPHPLLEYFQIIGVDAAERKMKRFVPIKGLQHVVGIQIGIGIADTPPFFQLGDNRFVDLLDGLRPDALFRPVAILCGVNSSSLISFVGILPLYSVSYFCTIDESTADSDSWVWVGWCRNSEIRDRPAGPAFSSCCAPLRKCGTSAAILRKRIPCTCTERQKRMFSSDSVAFPANLSGALSVGFSVNLCVGFSASTASSAARFRQVRIKKESTDNHLTISAFRLVGVTGFEPATTRPPELNFTFSNKFNELYSSGFYTYSASCDLPLSGVVTISRVPLVFHALHDLFL